MVSDVKTALVVGASKGVGLAVCQRLQKEGYKVYGTIRSSSPELSETGVEVIEGFDIATSDPTTLLKALKDSQLDLLVISAGIQEVDNLETVTRDILQRQMDINAYGPLFVVQALRQKLRAGGQVALIASKMGSITNVGLTGGDLFGYRMSKTALHMAGATMAVELKKQDVAVSLIHPGVVFTDMLRKLRQQRGVPPEKLQDNSISPEASADGIWRITQFVTVSNSGQCWAADSCKPLEW